MTPFNDGDAAVSHFPEPTHAVAVDRSRPPNHYNSNDASCEGSGSIQHNGHNNIGTLNHDIKIGVVNNIQNINYNPPTDCPTQSSHGSKQPSEGSCEQCETLRWLLVGVLFCLVPVIAQWYFSSMKQCLEVLCKLVCLGITCLPYYVNPHH
ncbi:hypothetical protein BKA59DRAFT_464950 [Fusarium tricinctum]|uniref:Uncharacterized protein n=1 Tax=Fusarium tricinctum TaxID=61284 RepID=A0A8K0WI54_9HYPO|nr:hypothetical protein BKA59DRAFT_464950 [Fusarium tricinctum]